MTLDLFTEQLTPENITQGLNTRRWRGPVWHFHTLTSTNDLAKELGNQGAPEGTLVVAEAQTAGRGRMGRQWVSPLAVGLYVSIILRPALPLEELPKITLTTAVAVVRAIRRATGMQSAIKWPNDIMLAGKKIGGILSEMATSRERLQFVVVGLGLNVNNPRISGELAALATSLAQESGRTFSRVRIVQTWLEEFETLYDGLLTQRFPDILKEWKELTITLGRQVTVRQGSREISGLALDVAPDGALMIKQANGKVVSLAAGEVIPRPGERPRDY